MASVALKSFVGLRKSQETSHASITTLSKTNQSSNLNYRRQNIMAAKTSPKINGRNLRVAIIGGGPAGGAAAETLAKGGVETILIERKMDNAKPCGGAIPLCMVGEFDLPLDIIDRRVTKMKMISPSNVAVDIGQTLKPHEYIGMVRREVLDAYLRERAAAAGAQVINGLFLKMDKPTEKYAPYVLHYSAYDGKAGSVGVKTTVEVDAVIGADGANSRVAKSIDAGDYEYAIAFQERIKIPEEKMTYYENLAEMYVGDDVSPDFYGWVFPKCDHVAVGTGTVTHKPDIKKFQTATRLRARDKILGGKIIRVEAHPIPEHPRPRRLADRVALVGDAAGYVTKCSGEGIYFAAKSGRMCAEAIVEGSENGMRMVEESDLRKYLEKWDKTYWPTYKVLDILQKVFYRSNPAREAFVEMCADEYVASEGAIRETWEEAGAKVEVISPFAQLDIPLIGQTYMIFLAKLITPHFSAGPESLECRLFALDDIPYESLSFSSMLVTLNLYIEDIKVGRPKFHYGIINKRPGTSPSEIHAYTLDYHLRT